MYIRTYSFIAVCYKLTDDDLGPHTISELPINAVERHEIQTTVALSTEHIDVNNAKIRADNGSREAKLYTVVLYLAGQQASGVQALINLQCQVHTLGLPVVLLEPVMVLNKFKAVPLVEYDASGRPLPNRVVRFGDLFDLDIFNNYSRLVHYAPLLRRDAFFANAPKKIVLVNLYQGEVRESPPLTRLWPQLDTPTGGCFDPLTSKFGSDTRYQAGQLVREGFCIVKVVEFRVIGRGQGRIFTESELKKSILGDMPYTSFTLVFNLWMPKFVLSGAKGQKCINAGYYSAKGQIQPSNHLLANAKYYKEHFLNSTQKYLALMIRSEHLYSLASRPRSDLSVRKCLNDAVDKVKHLQNKRSFGKPFVTLDIGRYGSKSIRRVGRGRLRSDMEYISKLLSSVQYGQWSMREWENSFSEATGGIEDSSYIAALQRTLASKAECLVLVGGGMFQELTMRKYMESHEKEDWCMHLFCVKNSINSVIAKS